MDLGINGDAKNIMDQQYKGKCRDGISKQN